MGTPVHIDDEDPTFRGALLGVGLVDKLEGMSWSDRGAYMRALMDILSRRYCQHCWYEDPKCQCSNGE